METLLAHGAFEATWIDLSRTKAACSSLTSSSSPPEISSTNESQLRGRRTSTFCHSHGFAASYQEWFTRHKVESVFRTAGSDQLPGGRDDGSSVGAPCSPVMSGSREEDGAGRPAEYICAQISARSSGGC